MAPLALANFESFYVGGTAKAQTSEVFGDDRLIVGALYAQRLVPAERRFPLPVIFIHGGMHTGVTWETTPDGREGWQTLFVREGFETIVIDQTWRGRSAPDLACLNPLSSDHGEAPPPAFTCGTRMAEQFTRGGDRFPSKRMDTYAAQLWPDFGVPAAFASGMPGLSDPRTQAPLSALLDRIGRAVLVTHSQGGDVGWRLAKARPDAVAAIYTVEPALTSPGLADEDFPDIPVCVMWGDNLPEESRTLSQVDLRLAREVAARRSNVTVDHLPDAGICGNGHMLMMEDNSAVLAERVMTWLHSLSLE